MSHIQSKWINTVYSGMISLKYTNRIYLHTYLGFTEQELHRILLSLHHFQETVCMWLTCLETCSSYQLHTGHVECKGPEEASCGFRCSTDTRYARY